MCHLHLQGFKVCEDEDDTFLQNVGHVVLEDTAVKNSQLALLAFIMHFIYTAFLIQLD